MKWLVLASILLAVQVYAAENADVLKFKNGVTFPHRAHQNYHKSDCKQCHRKEVGSGHIPNFSKDVAHRMCRTCHAMKQAGPASCKECHIKA